MNSCRTETLLELGLLRRSHSEKRCKGGVPIGTLPVHRFNHDINVLPPFSGGVPVQRLFTLYMLWSPLLTAHPLRPEVLRKWHFRQQVRGM